MSRITSKTSRFSLAKSGLEDRLHTRGINLHILSWICAGTHRPDGATMADTMLFMVAAMAAEMERALIRERTLDGLRAAQAQGRTGGARPWWTRTPSLSCRSDRPRAIPCPRSPVTSGSAAPPCIGRSRRPARHQMPGTRRQPLPDVPTP
jgi:hypothetical protein